MTLLKAEGIHCKISTKEHLTSHMRTLLKFLKSLIQEDDI